MRGNIPATVDAKNRLKVPAAFRKEIHEKYGEQVFLTSFTGENVLLYPLPAWIAFEERLSAVASMHPERDELLTWVNYFGQAGTMDKAGRVLIPQLVRESAQTTGEVAVMGKMDHLEIWNHTALKSRLEQRRFTDNRFRVLADLGV